MDLNAVGDQLTCKRGTRWLPRGAMDLNAERQDTQLGLQSWLPRGAMDLNFSDLIARGDGDGWLPRGAMDLN